MIVEDGGDTRTPLDELGDEQEDETADASSSSSTTTSNARGTGPDVF